MLPPNWIFFPDPINPELWKLSGRSLRGFDGASCFHKLQFFIFLYIFILYLPSSNRITHSAESAVTIAMRVVISEFWDFAEGGIKPLTCLSDVIYRKASGILPCKVKGQRALCYTSCLCQGHFGRILPFYFGSYILGI